MRKYMNVAAGVFGVMVPVALLVCGWNRMTKEKKGNVVFERDFGAETYRLVVSLGGKNKTVGGEHACNFVTFYRVTQN